MKALGTLFQRIFTVLTILAIVTIAVYLGHSYIVGRDTPQPISTVEDLSFPSHKVPPLHGEEFPVESFGPYEDRYTYENEGMELTIPKLNLDTRVFSVDLKASTQQGESGGLTEDEIYYKQVGEMAAALDNGVVLFNQSQLPSPNNANVSIAGHRDYKGKEFYYIDTLGKGDRIYLTYKDVQYVYEYQRTFVTSPSDWEPIATTPYSQITLQSCDPILAPNADYNRIFVVGILVDVYYLEEEGGVLPETTTSKTDPTKTMPSGGRVPDMDLPAPPAESGE